jgi:predicted nucleotidyltransferase
MVMNVSIPREALRRWAESKPTIKALFVFGSYARGEAQSNSDLDLAFEFTDVDEADAELICNAKAWKVELTQLTGITVKDLYHSTSAPVRRGPTVRVFPE